MITADTSKLEKQLQDYVLEATKRLENVAAGFAYELTLTASKNTPIGDEQSLGDETGTYYRLYEQRARDYGIAIEVGFHRGSWQYAENIGGLAWSTAINQTEDSAQDAYNFAQMQYKLGDTFYIGSLAPAIERLETGDIRGYSPGTISEPTLAQIQQAFAVDAARYYKEAI
jgi:hypothetical protein